MHCLSLRDNGHPAYQDINEESLHRLCEGLPEVAHMNLPTVLVGEQQSQCPRRLFDLQPSELKGVGFPFCSCNFFLVIFGNVPWRRPTPPTMQSYIHFVVLHQKRRKCLRFFEKKTW